MRFTVGKKILTGSAIIVAIGTLSMLIIYQGLNALKSAMHDLADTRQPSSAATYEMEINANGIGLGVLKYLDSAEPEYRELVQEDQSDFERFHSRYLELAQTTRELELGEAIATTYRQFTSLAHALMKMKDDEEALFVVIGENFEKMDDIIDNEMQSHVERRGLDGRAKVELLNDLEADFAEVAFWLANYNRAHKPEYRQFIFSNEKEFRSRLESLKGLGLTRTERRWLGELQATFDQTMSSTRKILSLDEELRDQVEKFVNLRSEIDRLLDEEIQMLSASGLGEPRRRADRATELVLLKLRFLIPVFVLSAVAVALLLIRIITRPIQKLITGTDAVRHGDLDHRIRPASGDEFADLARHFNEMVAQLRATTVSKELLEESEQKLQQTVAELRREITERKLAQEDQARLQAAVQKSIVEWRGTFDTIESPILILDSSGRVTQLNRAARELSGNGQVDVTGRSVGALGRGEPWSRATELVSRVRETHAPTFAQARDESSGRTWDIAASLFTGLGAEEERIILVAREITGLVELQASLRRSETMSVLGALVAGVAHEVRNPLFGISSILDAMDARFGTREEYQRYLDILRGQLDRLAELMRDLLDYGRPQSLELSPGSIEDVIALAVASCASLAERSEVRIVNDVKRGFAPVRMDRRRLLQVFQNLLENAIQHSPRGSIVGVEAEEVQQDGRSWIACAIADMGPGFKADELPRIFEPFFTRRRGGTGLGLSIVQRIVEEHGGTISVANHPEGGALMSVRLPLAPPEAM